MFELYLKEDKVRTAADLSAFELHGLEKEINECAVDDKETTPELLSDMDSNL